jgi:hypothetical protein
VSDLFNFEAHITIGSRADSNCPAKEAAAGFFGGVVASENVLVAVAEGKVSIVEPLPVPLPFADSCAPPFLRVLPPDAELPEQGKEINTGSQTEDNKLLRKLVVSEVARNC